MDELEALQLAINTLHIEAYYCKPMARKQRARSEERLTESELSERAARLTAATAVLESILASYQQPKRENQ